MIELRNISKSFHNRDSVVEAVRDINLTVEPRSTEFLPK
jgi:ABC-type oligopeptide transport system ATPase subunit